MERERELWSHTNVPHPSNIKAQPLWIRGQFISNDLDSTRLIWHFRSGFLVWGQLESTTPFTLHTPFQDSFCVGWVHSCAIILRYIQPKRLHYTYKSEPLVKLEGWTLLTWWSWSKINLPRAMVIAKSPNGWIIVHIRKGIIAIQVYLSSIQHQKLTPYMFVADISQMTWIELIRSLWTINDT